MKMKPITLTLIIFLLLFGGIAASSAAGYWTTGSDKQLAKYETGKFAGEYMPEDIRGSYTFGEIATLFEIDLMTLYEAFGIDPDTDGSSIKAKDLSTLYVNLGAEIESESLQLFVGLYKDLPITLNGSILPIPAVELVLSANPNLTEEQIAYLNTHQISLDGTEVSAPAETSSIDTTEIESVDQAPALEEEPLINGSVTVQQVLDAGITEEELMEVLGTEIPPTNQPLRDYCRAQGLNFTTVKDQLNGMLSGN